jgi:integrase
MARITNARLRRIQSGQSLTDAGLTARRQTENGAITLHFTYRHAGRQRWYRLGTRGQITLSQARTAVRKLAAQVAVGVDVQSVRMKERAEGTVAELCLDHISRAEAGKIDTKRPKKKSTLAKDRGRVENHIVGSAFGALKVSAVTRPDVQAFVRRLEKDVSPSVARRVASMLGGIFTEALKLGVVAHSPCTKIELPNDTKRERYLSPDEYRRLWDYTCGPAMPEVVRQAIRFAMFTGMRRSEITALCFDQIADRVVQLPDSKSGPSRRWLSVEATRCVERMRADHPGDRVFPIASGTLAWWLTHAGLDQVTLHTLRHSYATTALSVLGHRTELVACLIGHRTRENEMTLRYSHSLDADMLAAAATVSDAIERMCMAIETDVVAFRRT